MSAIKQQKKIYKVYNYTVDDVKELLYCVKGEDEGGSVEFKKRSDGSLRQMRYGFKSMTKASTYKDILFHEIMSKFHEKYKLKEIDLLSECMDIESRSLLRDKLDNDKYKYYARKTLSKSKLDLVESMLPMVKSYQNDLLCVAIPKLLGLTDTGSFFIGNSVVMCKLDQYLDMLECFMIKLQKTFPTTLQNYDYILSDLISVKIEDAIKNLDVLTGNLRTDGLKVEFEIYNSGIATSLNIIDQLEDKVYEISSGKTRNRSDSKHKLLTVFDLEKDDYRSVPLDSILNCEFSGKKFIFEDSET